MDSQHHGSESPEPVKPKESPDSSFSSESSIEYMDDEKFDRTNPFLHPENAKTGSPALSPQAVPGNYDPGRIPASVFSSKPTTPMDWSVASNESLFSIHVGNTSFSKDHVFMLFKSGELTKIDEYISVPPSAYPAIDRTEKEERESIDIGKDHREGKFGANKESELAQNMKISRELSTKSSPKSDQIEAQKVNDPETVPVSHEESRISTSSIRSFQFPLLDSDLGKDPSWKGGAHKQNFEKNIQQEVHSENQATTTTAPKLGWFSCFSCCTSGS